MKCAKTIAAVVVWTTFLFGCTRTVAGSRRGPFYLDLTSCTAGGIAVGMKESRLADWGPPSKEVLDGRRKELAFDGYGMEVVILDGTISSISIDPLRGQVVSVIYSEEGSSEARKKLGEPDQIQNFTYTRRLYYFNKECCLIVGVICEKDREEYVSGITLLSYDKSAEDPNSSSGWCAKGRAAGKH